MKKHLSSNGNTWFLYLNKSLLKLMGINPEDRNVLLTVKDDILYVRKINNNEIENYKNFFHKKLVKNRSSYLLTFTLPILELLDIDPEKDMVDYKINEEILIIKKADKSKKS